MQITDYGNSYIIWTSIRNQKDNRVPGHKPWENTVRALLDSRCWVTDESGNKTEYRLISPCRTEWMYQEEVLWQQPNHEYCGIHSDTEFMAGHIRTGDLNRFGGDWRSVASVAERMKRHEFIIRNFSEARELASDAETVEATMTYLPIVARTELTSADGRKRAVVEYPVRTMNVAIEEGRMQVDTGPVIYPDLEADVEREIESLHWAFVCYNTDDVAEFILRGPAPAGTHVDYHDVRRVAMKNRFYAAQLT